jgi:anti-sigma-K factor RskA
MRYDDPDLLDRLAAEYVLGTLHGAARRRFESPLETSQQAREAATRWRSRFAELATALPEQTPPPRVWKNISRAIDPDPGRPVGAFWRWWSIAASVALIAVLAFIGQDQMRPTPAAEQQVAFVNEDNLTPLWVVSLNFDTGELHTRAVSATAQAIDKTYELWMLPEQGNPQSLGLLPVNGGSTSKAFSPALLALLKRAQGLAVSIEPAGGSPTGLPTGPVVYQASLVEI